MSVNGPKLGGSRCPGRSSEDGDQQQDSDHGKYCFHLAVLLARLRLRKKAINREDWRSPHYSCSAVGEVEREVPASGVAAHHAGGRLPIRAASRKHVV